MSHTIQLIFFRELRHSNLLFTAGNVAVRGISPLHKSLVIYITPSKQGAILWSNVCTALTTKKEIILMVTLQRNRCRKVHESLSTLRIRSVWNHRSAKTENKFVKKKIR